MDPKINVVLFRRIDVWKRINDEKTIKYICFENLENNRFIVQNADFFYDPVGKKELEESEKRSVELFIESSPNERNKEYSSLNEAIEAHDKEFF